MKSSSSIKITKYPKALDPNNILQKKIEEKYGVCPFCGGDKNAKGVLGVGVVTSISTSYHKNKEHSFFQRLFEKPQQWATQRYWCTKCDARWESPEYPILEN